MTCSVSLCKKRPSCWPPTVDIQLEELSLELHVSVKSTRCGGLVCLHVFVQLFVHTETYCVVYGDYSIFWLFRNSSHPLLSVAEAQLSDCNT